MTAGAALVGALAVAALGCATAGSSNIHSAVAVRVDATNAVERARVMSEFGTVNFSGLTAFDYRMKSEGSWGAAAVARPVANEPVFGAGLPPKGSGRSEQQAQSKRGCRFKANGDRGSRRTVINPLCRFRQINSRSALANRRVDGRHGFSHYRVNAKLPQRWRGGARVACGAGAHAFAG